MIRQTELLLVFALTLLGAVHAITGPPTPFANSAGQGDCPLIGRPHFSQGIQNTTSRNVSIVTPVVANAARPEIPVNFGKVIPTGLPRLEPNNMKGQQIVRASELKEIKAGTPEPEPASGSPRIPRLSKIKDGGDEDTVLKKPPSRRQPGGKDQYPNPDRFPLKPEKQKPPQPVRRGPDNAAADTLYVKDSSPDPNRNSLLFDLGPVVVNAHSPPTPPEKGSVNRAFPQNGPVSRITRLQDRNLQQKSATLKAHRPKIRSLMRLQILYPSSCHLWRMETNTLPPQVSFRVMGFSLHQIPAKDQQ
ncbi:predicted protein [Histoplasma capsulatum var. duboisii H88]|nr:predicted protein [Histoplasma capsulatum var. duboisii H88]